MKAMMNKPKMMKQKAMSAMPSMMNLSTPKQVLAGKLANFMKSGAFKSSRKGH